MEKYELITTTYTKPFGYNTLKLLREKQSVQTLQKLPSFVHHSLKRDKLAGPIN